MNPAVNVLFLLSALYNKQDAGTPWCSPVSLLRVFGPSYHGIVSEGLLSIHHRLQMPCILNVNICLKRFDDNIIVFGRSLQILT